MEENFDDELLKAAISIDGVLGSHMGPRSPNTVFGYLYRRVGDIYGYKGPALVKGGMGAVGEALAASARKGWISPQSAPGRMRWLSISRVMAPATSCLTAWAGHGHSSVHPQVMVW